MSFTTPAFLLFLAVVYWLYWRLGFRQQNVLIFGASLFFYGWWDWRFLSLLFFTSTVDYWVALRLMTATEERTRKQLLFLSIASNLTVLGFFKYYNFFAGSFHAGMKTLGLGLDLPLLEVVLPLGISFYTFQALSYTIDVYRRELPAVQDYVQYMCFITFFPHMVAGPIQQATHFLVQFEKPRHFDWEESVDGARQMLWGFFKKMVIADSLAPMVEATYGQPSTASGSDFLWATYFFAFQIYCDFSGYTDIAIGCAKLFNFHLSRNFTYPYFSESIPEFWRRWHIALSNWFRRYLYIPLGGNRVSKLRWYLNILVVFIVSGLWHGANWTFLIWGFLHGLYFLGYVIFTKGHADSHELTFAPSPLWPRILKILLTFHLVCFAWIFFRAGSIQDAFLAIQKIGGAIGSLAITRPGTTKGLPWIALLLVVEWFARNHQHALARMPQIPVLRWGAYYALVLIIVFSAPLSYVPFIYFQF
jgi:D-alanyl-lipoteichoic acid acyltransferase DltB (MBOAT superfamily)